MEMNSGERRIVSRIWSQTSNEGWTGYVRPAGFGSTDGGRSRLSVIELEAYRVRMYCLMYYQAMAELSDWSKTIRWPRHRPLDFPSRRHHRNEGRPAVLGGSKFLFFVGCFWLLMKNLHPTNLPGDIQAGGSGSTISFPSSPLSGIMSAEASSGFAIKRYGRGAELNHMLASPGFTAARARGHSHGGCQPVFVDAYGGHYLVININAPQQGDQGVVAAAQDGKRNLAQKALLSVFGSLVPACFTLLSGDNFLNGASPGYIKAATCVVLGLVTGFTCLGLASKKRAMAAVRVVASMAMTSVSIALVYTVSENVYIKCTCGIIGAVATLATMAIPW